MTDEIKDTNILMCTLKKSASVCSKILLAIAGIWAIAVFVEVMFLLKDALVYIISHITLPTVPLWIIAAVGVVTVVIGYSALWCINRELTLADWKSDAASSTGVSLLFVSAAIWVVAWGVLAMSSVLQQPSSVFDIILFFGGMAPTVILVASIPLLMEDDDRTPRILSEFPGAVWNHYVVEKKK